MDDDKPPLEQHLEQCSTEELIAILRDRDEDEWRPEVFALVASILKARGIAADDVVVRPPAPTRPAEVEAPATIARFFSPAEAHASRMALEEAGIPAWITDEAGGTMYGVGIGSHLQVRATDKEAALEILASAAAPAETLPAELADPSCPACGSRNVFPEAWVDDSAAATAHRSR
jgi:hypothetical protein